jgi:hypothetical protein
MAKLRASSQPGLTQMEVERRKGARINNLTSAFLAAFRTFFFGFGLFVGFFVPFYLAFIG